VRLQKVFLLQSLVLLFLVVTVLIFSDSYHRALWVFIGGAIAVLAALVQSLFFKFFKWDGGGVVKLLLVAELAKFLVVALCFVIVVKFFPVVGVLWLLVGFAVTLFSAFFSLFFRT
jgi:hypothetical protein